jgi:hypothetical protein
MARVTENQAYNISRLSGLLRETWDYPLLADFPMRAG